MKTVVPKADPTQRKWYVVDADGEVLGRLASQVALILRGKHKPEFTPHLDMGDHVVIVNADKIRITGDKSDQKRYTRYSGYPGGLAVRTMTQVLASHPDRVIKTAVKGMLPKNKLGRQMFRKLKVYTGPEHPHAAQMPIDLPDTLRRT